MGQRVQDFVFSLLAEKTFKNDNDLYLYLILQVAAIFSGAMHLVLFLIYLIFGVVFSVAGVLPLAAMGMVNISILAIGYALLLTRKTYKMTGYLIVGTVLADVFLTALFIGADNYIVLYCLIVLIMQVIIPYTSVRQRVCMTVLLWVSIIITLLLQRYYTPLYAAENVNLVLSIFNVNLAFFGILIELFIGNIIRKLITHYNDLRMEELKTQANTDPLTGLHNRRYADAIFEALACSGDKRPWCVAMLDIDDFKQVNDAYGHYVGDIVLTMLAATMRSSLRKSDILFRWGGEEFLILLENVDLDTAYTILEKLRKAMSKAEVLSNGVKIQVTITIGVDILDMENIPHSISCSDEKLYLGKRNGKNVVIK